MTEPTLVLLAAPIVEAVLDIDCDLPPVVDFEALDAAGKEAFGNRYPNAQRRLLSEHEVFMQPGQPPAVSSREGLQAFLYATEDGRQMVQVRPSGYSFNRLAPYSSLDDYLPEIERTWSTFVQLVRPLVCRAVRMRYINRIELPLENGKVALEKYIRLARKTSEHERLVLTSLFDQQTLSEPATGSEATIVFATQALASNRIPVIFDITATKSGDLEPVDWGAILQTIRGLRDLKNSIFRNSLEPECLELFRH
jgi:uncharacterized protein (TIGR04255 family)